MSHIAKVLWLHGGAWRSRPASIGQRIAALREHRLLVVEGTYRLTGEAQWPAQLEDVRAAARDLRQQAPDLPLIIAGDSAGGHLALHTGLRGIDTPDDVDAVIAFWPPVDPLASDFPQAQGVDSPWAQLIGRPPVDGDPATADSSPLTHVGNGVPVLLVHGAQDSAIPATQTTALAAALLTAGHPVQMLVTHGDHGLDLHREEIHTVIRCFLTATLHAKSKAASGGGQTQG